MAPNGKSEDAMDAQFNTFLEAKRQAMIVAHQKKKEATFLLDNSNKIIHPSSPLTPPRTPPRGRLSRGGNKTMDNISLDFPDVASIADTDSCAPDLDDRASNKSEPRNRNIDQQANERTKMELARKETAAVFRLRLLVFSVLLAAAVTVSVIVYYITSNADSQQASVQYEGAAEKVLETFINIVESKMGAVSSLGVATIAHGVDHFRTWPFVTLSSFQQRSATARAHSGALYVHINPRVTDKDRNEWEEWVATDEFGWIEEGLEYQDEVGLFDFVPESAPAQSRRSLADGSNSSKRSSASSVPVWHLTKDDDKVIDKQDSGPYLPVWQTSPLFSHGQGINENYLRYNWTAGPAKTTIETESVVISEFITAPPGDLHSEDSFTSFFSLLLSTRAQEQVTYQGDPMSLVYFPIFDSFRDTRTPVATLVAWINWGSYFINILPNTLRGIQFVLTDSCSGSYTYTINGEQVIPLSAGDRHNPKYDGARRSASFDSVNNIADGTKYGLPLNQEHCKVVLDVYPSDEFYATYNSNTPLIITTAVAIIFVFTVCMFILYDRLVERRQALVMLKAVQTTAIVSSLFPENVRERLMQHTGGADKNGRNSFVAPHHRLKSFLAGSAEDDMELQPIADLCPHCTVLFADIAGFTAWSSARDPAQVFILLQTVYQAFDSIAKRRRVFKVETIGDSYVAVTGLPEPQANHAVIMARFASECLIKMNQLTSELETQLGPDTNDLTMRFGMHSGPVTAGVLRGDRARFQLFGDTVNTASRMESTGLKSRIQMSETTKDLLVAAGKSHWVRPRADAVQAKGKGYLKTYWLNPSSNDPIYKRGRVGSLEARLTCLEASTKSIDVIEKTEAQQKQDRLVDWMVEMMQEYIQKVVAQRSKTKHAPDALASSTYTPKSRPLDEVAEVIVLPRYKDQKVSFTANKDEVEVSRVVLAQLREFISIIASTYRNNPFHNFEHACHVTMATNKFIKRIVAPDIDIDDQENVGSTLHNYTHGINSDPLTVLAILFSAVIHDADHQGISNSQLIIEQEEMARSYGNQSVAEQNSLDIAWDLLMSFDFADLRRCLFSNQAELFRFRQVMVNVVLATDIFDKELNDLRKNRWNKAFEGHSVMSEEEKNDLRATIVIEHIIQASDVSHTMQHWHIYRKWNQRLFQEMYSAFKKGRMGKDPSTFWYKGELGFFDNYVIPLAKKLKDCNVFGVSSDECLNYATQNRAEWADRGQEIVAEMMNEISLISPESTPEITLMPSLSMTDSQDGDDPAQLIESAPPLPLPESAPMLPDSAPPLKPEIFKPERRIVEC